MTGERARPTPGERALHRRLARAMWTVEKGHALPADAAGREALWADDRPAMTARARKVINQLKRAGITLALDEDGAD
mgnify:CR=1 FL=1